MNLIVQRSGVESENGHERKIYGDGIMCLAKRPGPGRHGGFPRSSGVAAGFFDGTRLWGFAAGCYRRRRPGGNGGLFFASAGTRTGRARLGDVTCCATMKSRLMEN